MGVRRDRLPIAQLGGQDIRRVGDLSRDAQGVEQGFPESYLSIITTKPVSSIITIISISFCSCLELFYVPQHLKMWKIIIAPI